MKDPVLLDPTRVLQDSCPTPIEVANIFGADKASTSVLGWFGIKDDGTKNFIDEFVQFYFDETFEIATGKEIREGGTNDFSEVCNRLPLDDKTCYLAQDTTNLFIDKLIAKFVPFGEQLIAAKQEFTNAVEETQESLEEVEEFFSLRGDFLQDKGSCAAANENMIAVAEFPVSSCLIVLVYQQQMHVYIKIELDVSAMIRLISNFAFFYK